LKIKQLKTRKKFKNIILILQSKQKNRPIKDFFILFFVLFALYKDKSQVNARRI
jgi:hypothetical protein